MKNFKRKQLPPTFGFVYLKSNQELNLSAQIVGKFIRYKYLVRHFIDSSAYNRSYAHMNSNFF